MDIFINKIICLFCIYIQYSVGSIERTQRFQLDNRHHRSAVTGKTRHFIWSYLRPNAALVALRQ